METYLVTNNMYANFMAETNHREPLVWPGAHPDHPVLGVSRNDAEAYCKWAGGRLPSYDELPEELIPYWLWTRDIEDSMGVLRGCSWYDYPRRVRVSYRFWFGPTFRFDLIGFRCAEQPKERELRRR